LSGIWNLGPAAPSRNGTSVTVRSGG